MGGRDSDRLFQVTVRASLTVYCLQMLKVHEKSYYNLYFVFNCYLRICILEHIIVLCSIIGHTVIYKKQLSLLSDLQESEF